MNKGSFKQNVCRSLGLFVMLCLSTQAFGFIECSPYLGIDASLRRMPYHSGFGRHLLSANIPQGNVYGGLEFCDFLGFELGYESTFAKTPQQFLSVGDFGLGYVIPAGPTQGHLYFQRLRGWHADLSLFTPWLTDCCFRFFGQVGISRKRLRVEDSYFSNNGTLLSELQIHQLKRVFISRKTLMRFAVGIQQELTCWAYIRGYVGFEDTGKFKNLKSVQNPNGAGTVSPKASITYNLGFFLKF